MISVIITTKNEEAHIESCLKSIESQRYPRGKIEIILVDNNSRDKTKEIARKYTEKVYNFGPERSSQRNYGVKQASGEYILYLDADMTLSQGVIGECVDKCETEGCIAVYIPERIIGKGFWIKVRDFERSFYNGTCIDAVRFVRKDKFLETGGFDESLTGPEDWDFDRRVRQTGNTGIIESFLYHNEGDFNLREYLKKKTYYAKSFQMYIDKWGRNDSIIKKQFGFGYRFFGLFFENNKWRKVIAKPVPFLFMHFLRGIVGCKYLLKKAKKRYTLDDSSDKMHGRGAEKVQEKAQKVVKKLAF